MISQNGWKVIEDGRGTKYWNAGDARLQLRPGAAGWLLCHLATWFDQRLERLGDNRDDFGWSLRKIAGSLEWSNHASATAVDLNASAHRYGKRGTFTDHEAEEIHNQLAVRYRSLIRWGGDYHTTVDEMHWEITDNVDFDQVKILVAELRDSPIGKLVRQANPRS